MDNQKTQEQTFILTHSTSSRKKCEFEIVFQQPIILDQPSEIGLSEISLPNSVKTDKFQTDKRINFNLIWNRDNFPSKDYEKNIFLKTYQIDPNYNDSNILQEHLILPKIDDLQQLVEYLKISNFEKIITKLMRTRFQKLVIFPSDELKIEPPLIVYENEKFVNKAGKIEAKHSGSDGFKLLAFLYINLDFELHSILGFDVNSFPCFTFDYFEGKTFVRPINAPFKITDIGLIDVYYIYTDIVQETYVGNMKVNILRVFPRTDSPEDIIHYQFYNSIYIPLRVQEINSLRIEISDSLGQIAYYDKGDICLVLVIRPIDKI